MIDRSQCHPKAGVWAVLDGKQLRIECAECRAEVQTLQLDPSFAKCACGDPNCNKSKSNPFYLHCARDIFHTGNKVTVEADGKTAIVSCAECDAKPGRYPLAAPVSSAAN